ncbi:MAG TPA: DUF924 family protein [Candidatus Dormibacteraeota bacterium]|nr:DUF924 family protein [Candidatus Dormibacteraeota bacterium]
MVATAEFWFEFASTYSYPAAMRVEALARAAGVPLRWRAFLLGPIFAAQGWNDSPFNIYPVKGRYMWRDLARLCAAEGLPLRQPSVFPRGSLLAARVACAAADEPWIGAFVRAIYTANFAFDRPIGESDVVAAALRDLGIDAEAWLARAAAPEAKQRLRAQTDEAIARGLFGAPAVTVGEELFWGNDRLEQAIAHAAGADDDGGRSEAVLAFWFGPPDADAATRARHEARWFAGGPAVDAEVAQRFAGDVAAAVRRQRDGWAATARGRLALILLLDQFPRHLYRGRAEAFASDRHAQALALAGIDAGLDTQLGDAERAFFYMPLHHAEDLAVQERGVAAFAALHAACAEAWRGAAAAFLKYAREHRDVVARFGRFPHRNAVLGRPATAAERAYLEAAPRYGQ